MIMYIDMVKYIHSQIVGYETAPSSKKKNQTQDKGS